jgi:hypothetical protein
VSPPESNQSAHEEIAKRSNARTQHREAKRGAGYLCNRSHKVLACRIRLVQRTS